MKKIRKTYSGVVPNGKVLNSRNDSLQDTYSSDYLNRIIPDTKDLGEIIVDDIHCKNKCDNSKLKVAGLNGTTGSEIVATNRIITDYMSVNIEQLTISSSEDSQVYIFCYDSSKNYLGLVNSSWIATPYTFTPLANTKYLRVMLRKSDDSDLTINSITKIQLEKGPVATKFVEHKEFGKVKGNGVSTSSSFGGSTISTNSTTLANMGLKPTTLTVNNDDSTVIIFAKVGGLYNSSNSYGIVFDVNMDKTTFSSSGSKSIASANLRGNWSTDGTLKCEFVDMFIFKNVPKGEHKFYMYWATNDSNATAYSGYYAGISMTAIEL